MDPYRNYHGDKREMPCATFATWDMCYYVGDGGSLELFLFFTFPLNSKITGIRGRTRSKIRHTKNAKSRYVSRLSVSSRSTVIEE